MRIISVSGRRLTAGVPVVMRNCYRREQCLLIGKAVIRGGFTVREMPVLHWQDAGIRAKLPDGKIHRSCDVAILKGQIIRRRF